MTTRTGDEDDVPNRPGRRLPGQQVTCGWCNESVDVPRRGRVPKWCSAACRQRAWQHKKAAESERAAVDVVQQTVEVYRGEKVVEKIVQVPVRDRPKTGSEWAQMLQKLSWTLSTDRLDEADLRLIHTQLSSAVVAYERRWERLARRRGDRP